jgi:hypothetical protein
MNCELHPINPPKVVAVATDKNLTPTHPFPDSNLPPPHVPKYGQDFTFGMNRAAPLGHDVGKTAAELKPKMEKLLEVFASGDKSGMTKRLFTAFLGKQGKVTYFEDASLNTAAAAHANIKHFCGAALSAPGTPYQSAGKTRIHQALKQANWDLKKMIPPTDLGVPAFNQGSKIRSTEDYGSGLGVMVNSIQHVFVIATHYHHDKSNNKYCIRLKYLIYDVFGLDDDDLKEYGAKSDGLLVHAAPVGITAWWQLQHQHGYAPLVTRIVVENTYEAPTT